MNTIRTRIWFEIKPNGRIKERFGSPDSAEGPYELVYQIPPEVAAKAEEQRQKFEAEKEARRARRIPATVEPV